MSQINPDISNLEDSNLNPNNELSSHQQEKLFSDEKLEDYKPTDLPVDDNEPISTSSLPSSIDRMSSNDDEFEDARENISPCRRISVEKIEEAVSLSSPARSIGGDSLDPWRSKLKHILILSDAGKPIFSLHGESEELVSITAVVQAMVSYVDSMNDSLRSINVTQGKIVFLHKSPIILVVASRGMESETQLIVQLTYMYNQLLSLLTLTQITKIFEERQGFDLRRMISGSERILQSLSNAMDLDMSFMLSAVSVLPLSPQYRDPISNAISQACSKSKNILFAILLADNQLITLVRMKKYYLHPADIHLIFNLVNSSESFKHSETWMPICLPKFNSSGFMQAHVSYLSENHSACLVMLTVEREIFFEVSNVQKTIVESLLKHDSLNAISDALNQSRHDTVMESTGTKFRHFLFKANTAAQFTSSKYLKPYDNQDNRQRLHGLYLQIQNSIHSSSRPLKLYYYEGQYENIMGWITSTYEFYCCFSPTTSKVVAIESIHKLVKWYKKEEQTLFILNAPTF